MGKIVPALRAAVPALAACAVALGGLTAWTAIGAAGRPACLGVTDARVILPFGGDAQTAAFFQLRNTGGSDDDLVAVTSPDTGHAQLAHTFVRAGTGTMAMAASATVPAHGTLSMSPYGLDVMVDLDHPPRLRAGELVPFVLHFRDSGSIRIAAVVVRP